MSSRLPAIVERVLEFAESDSSTTICKRLLVESFRAFEPSSCDLLMAR